MPFEGPPLPPPRFYLSFFFLRVFPKAGERQFLPSPLPDLLLLKTFLSFLRLQTV